MSPNPLNDKDLDTTALDSMNAPTIIVDSLAPAPEDPTPFAAGKTRPDTLGLVINAAIPEGQEPGALPPDVPALEPLAPAPGAPAPRFGGKPNTSVEKMHAVQRQKRREMLTMMQKIIDVRLEEDLEDPQWVFKTKRELCKATKRELKTVNLIIRYNLKIAGGLDALRRAKLGMKPANDPRHEIPEDDAKPGVEASPLWKWNILDLFDRLMQFFDIVDTREDDDADDEPIDEGDPRRTWIAWRVFLAAAFGLDREQLDHDHSKFEDDPLYYMPHYPGVADETVPRAAANVPAGSSGMGIFTVCTGRQVWPAIRAKIVSIIVGRRGGKSYITAIIGIFLATRKYKLKLGTKGMVMILARDREQAGVIRGYVLAFLRALDELREQFADDPTQKLIELKNGITIEVRAAGEAGTRGYTVVAALMDEIAFWPTDPDSAKQDKKVLRALRPAMLGIKDAMIVMLSSPYAKRGELWENFRKAFGKDDQTRYLVWQADTLSMRPSDDPELLGEIKDEYEDDPESAKAEYGALFRTDLENIYSRTNLERCSIAGRFEEPYRKGTRYRAFVDPSGGSSDSYVLAIGHEEERTVDKEKFKIPVLDFYKEWVPKFDPAAVSKEVIDICKRYKISSVTGDAYGGEWPRDPLKKGGINYVLSEKTRSELYLDFLPVVNSAQCELLDMDHHRKAMNQFTNLERRVGRTGRDSVDHPPGGHDDVANGIAGVMVGCKAGGAQQCTW